MDKNNETLMIEIKTFLGLVPATASELYANNLVHLINLLADKTAEVQFNAEDEIIQQAVLCHNGKYMPFEPAKETNNA